jgi:pimeloyl-ACP methyl ester carboxylesterase
VISFGCAVRAVDLRGGALPRAWAFRGQEGVRWRENRNVREEAVAVRGATLWTVTTGQGSDAVVLCHGGPGLSDNLEPVASMIDDLAVIHRFDQRGGGRSTGSPPFVVSNFIEDLEALRVHWQHDSWISVAIRGVVGWRSCTRSHTP